MNQLPLAFILINVESGAEGRVLNELKQLEKTRQAYLREAAVVYGLYDVVASVEAENMEQLNAFVADVRKVVNVKNTLTMIVASGS